MVRAKRARQQDTMHHTTREKKPHSHSVDERVACSIPRAENIPPGERKRYSGYITTGEQSNKVSIPSRGAMRADDSPSFTFVLSKGVLVGVINSVLLETQREHNE